MHWQQITLRLTSDELPRVEALLRLAGCHAISVTDDGDEPILEPAVGETPVWPRVALRALFPDAADIAQIAALVGVQTGASRAEIERIADADWVRAWRQTITPIRVGSRLEIAPVDGSPSTAGRLVLNMGLAFGTGRHPTTRLCLEWLADRIRGGETVLDYGCGSGILALAALRLGASYAWATDDDPQALAATADNVKLNDVGDSIWIGPPGALQCGHVDLIVANILAGPLAALAPSFAALQSPGARIVLSGVLPGQATDVEAAYADFYRSLTAKTSGGWSRIVGLRREAGAGPRKNAKRH